VTSGNFKLRTSRAHSFAERVGYDRITVTSGEHEIIAGGPTKPKGQALLLLPAPVGAHLRDDRGRDRDNSAAGLRLRCLEAEPGLRLLQRAFHAHLARIEVDVPPSQREQLAAPHASRKTEDGD
jgi:hypothetical protein